MHVTMNQYLGREAREARLRLALTQAQVARRLGLATAVYGRIERGHMTPSLPTLVQLCAVLGLDANALLGFTSPTPPPWLAAAPSASAERPAIARLRPLLRRLTRPQVLALTHLAHCMRPAPETRA